MKEFIEFIREQGVVGLAVGFILGGAVSKLVASLVSDIIQPVIGMILGSTEGLAAMTAGPIAYGSFIATLIDFAIIAFVVYAVFSKIAAKMDKKK